MFISRNQFLLSLFVYAMIGIVVGMSYMLANMAIEHNQVLQLIVAIIQSAGIGLIIGITIQALIYSLYLQKFTLTGFFVIFFVSAAMTVFFSWLMGVRRIELHIMMVIIAEVLSFITGYTQYKYFHLLNKKLEERKKEFKL